MVSDWSTIPFERLLNGPVRNGIYKPKSFHGYGAKIVNMGELFAHPRLRAVPMKRVALSRTEADRFSLAKGDLLFARRSLVAEGAGKCSVVLEVDEETTFESSIIRARPDCAKADSVYLYYFFNSPHGLHCLDSIRRQVAVAGITGSDLSRLEIPVPSLVEQRAIAGILGTLDEKVELNWRMSETLETIAVTLFKARLVEVDSPRVRVADLIREGTLEIGDGYRAKNTELGSPGLPFVRAGDLKRGFDLKGADVLSESSLPKVGTKMSRSGDVAFTSKGTIGRFARVPEGTAAFVYSPQICFWRSLHRARLHPDLLYCWMLGEDFGSQVAAVAGQTDMAPYVSLRDQRAMEMPIFGESQSRLGDQIGSVLERQALLSRESAGLTDLRNTLLPKLISGELRIPDAERILGKAL